jgi:hypothetical protein
MIHQCNKPRADSLTEYLPSKKKCIIYVFVYFDLSTDDPSIKKRPQEMAGDEKLKT